MTAEQIKIADLVLNFLKQKNGKANIDQLTWLLTQNNINTLELIQVKTQLINQGYLENPNDNDYFVTLTQKGESAQLQGVLKYERQVQKQGKLEGKRSTQSLLVNIIMAVVAIVAAYLAYLQLSK